MVYRRLYTAMLAIVCSAAGAIDDPYPSAYVPRTGPPVLIRNATVLTGTGTRLDGADVLLRDGKIAAVGTAVTGAGRRHGDRRAAAAGSRPA